MKKVVVFFLLTLFLLMPVLPIEANEEVNSEVELDLTQFSGEVAGPPDVIVNDAKLRYGWDLLIYSGEVNVNAWAVPAGVDDESIDVDYFAGDTLRAVVACPDSLVRIFRSNDRGQNWSQVGQITFGAGGAAAPHIIHGPDSTYHVFCLYVKDEVDIYAQARRTANDLLISGSAYFLTGDDSVNSYSVCTDRVDYHNYSVYLVYNEGTASLSSTKFTRTTDMGQNWTTPAIISQPDVNSPNITYGGDDILYLSYIYTSAPNIYARARRSLNSGSSWGGFITLESDTFPKMAPQIAAAYDGSGDVWVIWPKKDLTTANDDWGLRWSWSQDSAVTWTSAGWVNSEVDSNDYLPSIAVNDYNGSTDHDPYVSFVRATYSGANPSVRSFNWSSGAWGTETRYSNYGTSLTRPIQTFNYISTTPAIAYVGEGSENVYFDSWESSGVEEKDVEAAITCSLDRSIITGTATLEYTLATGSSVDISLFNVLGQKVATLFNGVKEAGKNTLTLSSDGLSQGVYYITVETPFGRATAKATVIK